MEFVFIIFIHHWNLEGDHTSYIDEVYLSKTSAENRFKRLKLRLQQDSTDFDHYACDMVEYKVKDFGTYLFL